MAASPSLLGAGPSAATTFVAPAPAKPAANIGAIVAVIFLELFGDGIAAKQGTSAFPIIIWIIATIIGIYLILTASIANKIVGWIKIGLFAFWLGGLVIGAANNRLSGTYYAEGNTATITFTSDGKFAFVLYGGDTSTGTYTVKDNQFLLDPTSGQAANDPSVANNPFYQVIASQLQGTLSRDHNSLEMGGQEYDKR